MLKNNLTLTLGAASGNDVIYPTYGQSSLDIKIRNEIVAGAGDDLMFDTTYDLLNDGSQIIAAQTWDDEFDGGADDDFISINAGNDIAIGGDGRDVIYTGTGDDRLYANGQITLTDALVAGDQTTGKTADSPGDWLDAGDGNDLLIGDIMDDALFGWAGDDTLSGGAGNDTSYLLYKKQNPSMGAAFQAKMAGKPHECWCCGSDTRFTSSPRENCATASNDHFFVEAA